MTADRGAATDRLPARAGVRLMALAALLVLGLVRWFALLSSPDDATAVLFALLAAAVAGALAVTGRMKDGRVRAAALVAAALALIGGALLAAGVPLWMLDPRDWGVLVGGLADGTVALPGVTVPYRGVNDWVGITLLAGGTLLVAFVALAAGWPRRGGGVGSSGWAVFGVGVLFAVPAIHVSADSPWLVGALFAVPLCVFVLAERLPARLGALGGAVVLAAVALGMAAAPALDADGPIVDVQEIASAIQRAQPDRFDWSHGYGPMDWPRDGREVMRVRARRASYWKADDLEFFDGVRWGARPGANPLTPIAEGLGEHPGWRQEIRVTIVGMETRQFISPGETLSISRAPRQPINTRAGGFSVRADEDGLSKGDAYLAEAYVPRPGSAELRAAGVDYPAFLADQLTMLTPAGGPWGRTLIRFMPFGSGRPPLAAGPGVGPTEAVAALVGTGYGEVYSLAQRLAAVAVTPYDFVRRVERYLADPEFVYDEQPEERRLPIPAFLLRDKAGYCQHYSAAMALLLRMGGVPARVAGGFTAGELNRDRREYVVRDTDAHSWVEAWFPGVGWVAFDPTPGDAPARARPDGATPVEPSVVPGSLRPEGAAGRRAERRRTGTRARVDDAAQDASGAPWGAIVAALAGGAAGWGGWRVWRARRRRAADEDTLSRDLAELQRALRRAGWPVAPGTTLLQLERRYPHSDGARAYLRALSQRRYGAGGQGPGRAERRALRRELAGGRGWLGRLRALWALPPRGGLH